MPNKSHYILRRSEKERLDEAQPGIKVLCWFRLKTTTGFYEDDTAIIKVNSSIEIRHKLELAIAHRLGRYQECQLTKYLPENGLKEF